MVMYLPLVLKTYGGPVRLAADIDINASSTTFSNAVNSINNASDRNLDIVTGSAEFEGVVGGVDELGTLDVGGLAIIGTTITTSGTQTYDSDIDLDGATTLTSTGGGFSFGGTIEQETGFGNHLLNIFF